MKLNLLDKNIRWWGVQSLEEDGELIHPWRMNYKDKDLYFDGLRNMLRDAAGVKISFYSDTQSLCVNYKMNEIANSTIDLYVDGSLVEEHALDNLENVIFKSLVPGKKLIELWLPQKNAISLRSIEIDDGAIVEYDKRDLKKWIVYGSSITQCGAAFSSSRTWPAIVARKNNIDLTCLGVSGQCHLDIPMGMMIRDLPADYISLGLGINIMGASSLSVRTFRTGVIGFIHLIREKHKTTPLMINSPIYSPPREQKDNLVELSLIKMREAVKDAVKVHQDRGDENISYVDGLDIFGEDLINYLPDELHPDGRGYELLAENYDKHVGKAVFGW